MTSLDQELRLSAPSPPTWTTDLWIEPVHALSQGVAEVTPGNMITHYLEVEVDDACKWRGGGGLHYESKLWHFKRKKCNSLPPPPPQTDGEKYMNEFPLTHLSDLVCITWYLYCSHDISFPISTASSNALFSFSLCALFRRLWDACISVEKAWQAGAQGRRATRGHSRIPAPQLPKKSCLYWLCSCELTGTIVMTERMLLFWQQFGVTWLMENILTFSLNGIFFTAPQ